MDLNLTQILTLLLGSSGVTLLVTLVTLRPKIRKANAEADDSVLSNLEKGFKLQSEQLERAQEQLLEYQKSLKMAYEKIQSLTTEVEQVREDLKRAKLERDSLKREVEKFFKTLPKK